MGHRPLHRRTLPYSLLLGLRPYSRSADLTSVGGEDFLYGSKLVVTGRSATGWAPGRPARGTGKEQERSLRTRVPGPRRDRSRDSSAQSVIDVPAAVQLRCAAKVDIAPDEGCDRSVERTVSSPPVALSTIRQRVQIRLRYAGTDRHHRGRRDHPADLQQI